MKPILIALGITGLMISILLLRASTETDLLDEDVDSDM